MKITQMSFCTTGGGIRLQSYAILPTPRIARTNPQHNRLRFAFANMVEVDSQLHIGNT